MNKASVKESLDDELAEEEGAVVPGGPLRKNYMTPGGFARLKAELDYLVGTERPALVQTVSWAAGNGDRSENGDYIYGKKRLREIDRRIRFLVKRLDTAEVIDPEQRAKAENSDQIFFGATVTVVRRQGAIQNRQQTVSIVGADEIDLEQHYISWLSPMAQALLKAREGDIVRLRVGEQAEEIEVQEVVYHSLVMKPFQP